VTLPPTIWRVHLFIITDCSTIKLTAFDCFVVQNVPARFACNSVSRT